MTPSARLADEVVHALAAIGVREVVLCPGSRSAPLAYALDDAERAGTLRLHVRHDERAACFTALGMAGGGSPAAVVTTSGTAVANLHPAVLEAHHSGLPLILLTADRPRAVRGTWVNQTSELQQGLFGAAVRAATDVDSSDDDPRSWRSRIRRCLLTAIGGDGIRPGPVHLNLGFSEPLVPQGDEQVTVDSQATPPRQPRTDRPVPTPLALPSGPRTLVLAGDRAGPDARILAETARWPLLAEPSSGALHGSAVVQAHRLLLEHAEFADPVERVVVYGRPTLSRQVTRLLGRSDVELVLVSPWPDWPDPGREATRAVAATASAPTGSDREAQERWTGLWRDGSRRARRGVDDVLDGLRTPTGPTVARAVVRALTPGQSLVVAASNPIRDVDLVAEGFPDDVLVASARGLSGIDGTLSSAMGHALATGRPTRVLLGDIAFLHDLNGLLAPPGEVRPDSLQVVVANDAGGGIFSLLEYGRLADEQGPTSERARQFERLFGTPHRADLGALCQGLGLPHRQVHESADLDDVLTRPAPGVSVIEVETSRAALIRVHDELRASVAKALAQ